LSSQKIGFFFLGCLKVLKNYSVCWKIFVSNRVS